MARRRTKVNPTPCPFCKKVNGMFLFTEGDDVGLTCPRCGTLGPRVAVIPETEEDLRWNLAAKEWNHWGKHWGVDFAK